MTVSALPILYSFRRCPYAMRARHALLVTGQQVEIREVVLRDKPPQLHEASQKATVPVLVLPDGSVIDESIDIIDWALEQADPEGWRPTDPASVAETDALVTRNDGPFKHHLDRYKYSERGSAVSLSHRAEAEEILASLDARLESQAHLLGSSRTRVDVALLPFVRQFANADRRWFDAMPWTGLQRWLRDYTDSAAFARVMVKLPRWTAGDAPRFFPEAPS